MPQLEFTLWVINCISNWSTIFIMVLIINSSALDTNNIMNTTLDFIVNSKNTFGSWTW